MRYEWSLWGWWAVIYAVTTKHAFHVQCRRSWAMNNRGICRMGTGLCIALSVFATPNINLWTRPISLTLIHFHLSSPLSEWTRVSHITNPVMQPMLEFGPNVLESMWIAPVIYRETLGGCKCLFTRVCLSCTDSKRLLLYCRTVIHFSDENCLELYASFRHCALFR